MDLPRRAVASDGQGCRPCNGMTSEMNGANTSMSTANRRRLAATFLIVNGVVTGVGLVTLAASHTNLWYAGLSAAVFVVQSLYVRSSVRWLPESEVALISVLGAPIYSVSKTGRYLAPALISHVWSFPREPMTATVVCPNVLAGRSNREHAADGLPDGSDVAELVPDDYVHVSVIVQLTFQVVPALLPEFIATFGNVQHAQRILESTLYCDVAAELGKRGIRDSMRNATALCAALTETCHSRTNHVLQAGGVNVLEMRIVKIDFGESLTSAMESVDEAAYNAAAVREGDF